MRFLLKDILTESGLSQADLARRTGWKAQFVQTLVGMERANVTVATLERLCRALACEPGDLVRLDAAGEIVSP